MGLCVTITPIRYIDPSGLYYLEKDSDGRIYAIIESGDTLSGIAKGEVADPNAWRKMNYSGDPAKLQVGQRVDVTGIYNNEYKIENIVYAGKTPDGKPRRSLPPTGEPNSKDTLYNPDGTPKQVEYMVRIATRNMMMIIIMRATVTELGFHIDILGKMG